VPPPPVPTEADYYTAVEVAPQEGLTSDLGDLALEVGGLEFLDAEHMLVATRRGEVWLVTDYATEAPVYSLYADGLHEPLGLLARDGWVYYEERGDLSRMRDTNGDGRADDFEIVSEAQSISGNYHEYAFGPRLDADGNFWVTLNRPFGSEPFGKADFRGWAARISPDGSTCEMVCSGLRSPAGLERAPWGDMFYTDNQGEWVGTNKLCQLIEGKFYGHPYGVFSASLPMSRVPEPSSTEALEEKYRAGALWPEVAKEIPNLELPAIWLPYDKLGRSATGMSWDTSGGKFGPFEGQLFIGDQYEASLIRVALEKVDGVWQGAAFPFRHQLDSGVIRARFDPYHPGDLYVGLSDRGWASIGVRRDGLQRVQWSGKTPFEIKTMTVRPDGFRLTLTRPCDKVQVTPGGFRLKSYTYELHEEYGSDEMDNAQLEVASATVSDDGLVIDLVVGSGSPLDLPELLEGVDPDSAAALHPPLAPLPAPALRLGYVHELVADCLHDATTGHPLLHPDAYYTLNRLPQ
jgi:hypothetical protein